jgi:DNA replication protein DnaC
MSTNDPKSLHALTMGPGGLEAWLETLQVVSPDARDDDDNAAAQRRSEAMSALSNTIPDTYRWARFSAPELSKRAGKAVAKARDDELWKCPRLVFMGPAGSGKTSVAVACLRRWVHTHARAGGFFNAFALGNARLQHPAGRGEAELVEQAMKRPLVLLDDLGSERSVAGCAVPDVIYERHAYERPIWITTGLTRPQISERYGDGIARRVFERATVLPFGA